LKNIWMGQSLQVIEAQKAAIHDAFSEREIEAELLEAELEEKNKAIQKAQKGILIDEVYSFFCSPRVYLRASLLIGSV